QNVVPVFHDAQAHIVGAVTGEDVALGAAQVEFHREMTFGGADAALRQAPKFVTIIGSTPLLCVARTVPGAYARQKDPAWFPPPRRNLRAFSACHRTFSTSPPSSRWQPAAAARTSSISAWAIPTERRRDTSSTNWSRRCSGRIRTATR